MLSKNLYFVNPSNFYQMELGTQTHHCRRRSVTVASDSDDVYPSKLWFIRVSDYQDPYLTITSPSCCTKNVASSGM